MFLVSLGTFADLNSVVAVRGHQIAEKCTEGQGSRANCGRACSIAVRTLLPFELSALRELSVRRGIPVEISIRENNPRKA